MPLDDRQLLLRTHRGDSVAAAALWSKHAGVLRAYARTVLGHRAATDAEDDAVQSAFCRVLDTPEGTLAAVLDVRAWLLTLTRNAALMHLRSARRERGRRERATATRAGRASSHSGIQAAVDALPRRLREVMVLRHIAGLSFDQLAAAIGIPRSTVSSRYERALRTLRDAIEPTPVPVEEPTHV